MNPVCFSDLAQRSDQNIEKNQNLSVPDPQWTAANMDVTWTDVSPGVWFKAVTVNYFSFQEHFRILRLLCVSIQDGRMFFLGCVSSVGGKLSDLTGWWTCVFILTYHLGEWLHLPVSLSFISLFLTVLLTLLTLSLLCLYVFSTLLLLTVF